ncbi:uncharacterized protein LOC129228230 [Uloborus diversus]|uniref:uncharacterized protein LOC129228230 n=1 Tax=Uloborus diversus TaxID=327109 RepID=UPI00240A59B4|nr:uncharacterized protein LOC129228230 [Uloborus diversus]
MKSVVLVAVVFLLHVLKADGKSIFEMDPVLSELPLFKCIKRQVCDCGEENTFKICSDMIGDAGLSFLRNNTEICLGLEDRTAKGESWICDDASSYEQKCGEEILNNFFSPDFVKGQLHVAQLEVTLAERIREIHTFHFFTCVTEVLARCLVYPDEC